MLPTENVSQKTRKVSAETKKQLSHLVELDEQLYRAAIDEFNRERPRILISSSNSELMPGNVIDVCGRGSKFLRDGWHDIEYLSGIVTWRWTGPTNDFSIAVPALSFDASRITIKVTAHRPPAELAEVHLVYGDQLIKPNVSMHDTGYNLCFNLQTANMKGCESTILTFRAPNLLTPPRDKRRLGIPVQYISIQDC